MKRLLSATLALCALLLGAPTASAKSGDRNDYVSRIETCEAILREFQADPALAIPAEVLARAKGIVIVNQFQGGVIIGIKDGWGVAAVKRANGQWSVPAILRAGEVSVGLQLGAKSVETIYVLMDEAATQLLFKPRFNFGVDAKAVAGPRARDAEAATSLLTASVLAYPRSTGLYAGATIKTGYLSPDSKGNATFYGRAIGMPELLYSNWVNPPAEVQPLMAYLQSIAGGGSASR